MSRSIHVTHVVLSLDVGGLERNVVNQVREAAALNQAASVLCVEGPGALAPAVEALGARVVALGKRPGVQWKLAGRLARALADLRPDVVHTHHIGSLFYTGLATRRVPVPVVVHTEHGREDYHRFRTRWLGRAAARRCQLFYCLTEDLAGFVAGHRVVRRRKLRVIRNGIDTAAFRDAGGDPAGVRAALGVPAAAPVVGTVGRLTEVKRQDVLLRAFARVQARLPDAHLVVVGDGPRRADLERLARELEVAHRVRFVGFQPSSAPYLHAMDVFALTSRSEGMPQALLEACVAGRPVVASAVGGVPEVVTHDRTGLLFPDGDEGRLADGLLALLADRGRGRALGAAARDLVEGRYSVRRMAREYDAHFRALLVRAPARTPVAAR